MRNAALIVLAMTLILPGCLPPNHWVKADRRRAVFLLEAPRAKRVDFYCSLDSFKPRTARRDGNGIWRVSVPAVREFRYFYLVDGTFVLPQCPQTETDDLGSSNCIFSPGM